MFAFALGLVFDGCCDGSGGGGGGFRPSLEAASITLSLHYIGPNSVVLLHLTGKKTGVWSQDLSRRNGKVF